jgi:hypothetical protein
VSLRFPGSKACGFPASPGHVRLHRHGSLRAGWWPRRRLRGGRHHRLSRQAGRARGAAGGRGGGGDLGPRRRWDRPSPLPPRPPPHGDNPRVPTAPRSRRARRNLDRRERGGCGGRPPRSSDATWPPSSCRLRTSNSLRRPAVPASSS